MHFSVFSIYLTASFVKCVKKKNSVFSTDPSSVFFRNPSFSPPFTFATCYSLLYELRRMLVDSQTGRASGFPTANRVSEEARRFLWPYLGQHRLCARPEEHFPGPKMICCLPSMTRKISERRQHRSWLHQAGLRGEKKQNRRTRERIDSQEVWHTQQTIKKEKNSHTGKLSADPGNIFFSFWKFNSKCFSLIELLQLLTCISFQTMLLILWRRLLDWHLLSWFSFLSLMQKFDIRLFYGRVAKLCTCLLVFLCVTMDR